MSRYYYKLIYSPQKLSLLSVHIVPLTITVVSEKFINAAIVRTVYKISGGIQFGVVFIFFNL